MFRLVPTALQNESDEGLTFSVSNFKEKPLECSPSSGVFALGFRCGWDIICQLNEVFFSCVCNDLKKSTALEMTLIIVFWVHRTCPRWIDRIVSAGGWSPHRREPWGVLSVRCHWGCTNVIVLRVSQDLLFPVFSPLNFLCHFILHIIFETCYVWVFYFIQLQHEWPSQWTIWFFFIWHN